MLLCKQRLPVGRRSLPAVVAEMSFVERTGLGHDLGAQPVRPGRGRFRQGSPPSTTVSRRRQQCLPSGVSTSPRKAKLPPSNVASAAMGVRQEPSSACRKARSAVVVMACSAMFSGLSKAKVFSSPARAVIASAPCPGAGGMASLSTMEAACVSSPSRFNPASAR